MDWQHSLQTLSSLAPLHFEPHNLRVVHGGICPLPCWTFIRSSLPILPICISILTTKKPSRLCQIALVWETTPIEKNCLTKLYERANYYIEQVLCEEHLEFINACSVLAGPQHSSQHSRQTLLINCCSAPDAFGYDLWFLLNMEAIIQK